MPLTSSQILRSWKPEVGEVALAVLQREAIGLIFVSDATVVEEYGPPRFRAGTEVVTVIERRDRLDIHSAYQSQNKRRVP